MIMRLSCNSKYCKLKNIMPERHLHFETFNQDRIGANRVILQGA